MKKIVVTILGYDRPGIIAAISKVLLEKRCNIEDVSQTILQTEFIGVFIASRPDGLSNEELTASLQEKLSPKGLSVIVKSMGAYAEESPAVESEPFVITTVGPDRIGLVAGITEILAGFRVNITNLRAVFRGNLAPKHNMMIYEVDIPSQTDQHAFRETLYKRARELELDISLQHRDIFEMIHSV